jgi:glutamine amidotransferase-like uncharacterized protein
MLVLSVVLTALVWSGASLAAPTNQARTYIISLDKNGSKSAQIDEKAAIKLVNQLLEQGAPVKWALEGFQAGGRNYPAGTFLLQTPFQTTNGISSDVVIAWLEAQGKQKGVYPIRQTPGTVQVESKALVLPRICLFYDQTTYENCLKHYQLFTSMGFKVTLATANDLLVSFDDPSSVLARSNIFIMPGGAMHLWAFAYEDQAKGIENIQKFVKAGGGYVGVCAGSSEALAQTPYANLGLVDANYHFEWFDYADPAAGDWDWRALIGPMNLTITQPQNPVMFGYGTNAVRPGYATPAMYYWGGPAMFNEGSSVTVLARYLSPAAGQTTSDKVKDIWGAAAVVTTDYELGKVVLFGPHPEWPGAGPVTRMYAQALYYVSTVPKASSLEPSSVTNLPATISAGRVQAITRTVAQARPLLTDSIRKATTLNNLPLGGTYHPLGLWYGGSVLVYSQALKGQMDELSRDARTLQQEYARLNKLKSRLANDPQALQWIATSQAYIEQFFSYAENLPSESHVIAETDWTGAGPFKPYAVENEAKSFPDLLWAYSYLQQEIRNVDLPVASAYAPLLAEYDALRAAYLLDPTSANKQAMDDKYMAISSSWPAGPMYKGMYTLRHTLDIMQYKVDTHLLNLLTRAERAKEVLSISKYALADKLVSWKH